MVGLGQVDELEVEGEGAGKLVGGGHAERLHTAQRVLERVGGGGRTRLGGGSPGRWSNSGAGGIGFFGFAAGDSGLAQLLDRLEDRQARLLAQHLAQQHAERAHVAAQRHFLELAGGRLQLGQALRPVGSGPE